MRAFYYLFLYFLITCFQYTFTHVGKIWGGLAPQAPDERRLYGYACIRRSCSWERERTHNVPCSSHAALCINTITQRRTPVCHPIPEPQTQYYDRSANTAVRDIARYIIRLSNKRCRLDNTNVLSCDDS